MFPITFLLLVVIGIATSLLIQKSQRGCLTVGKSFLRLVFFAMGLFWLQAWLADLGWNMHQAFSALLFRFSDLVRPKKPEHTP